MKAMLLAAGEGTRFRPHTLKLPKPALPFLNVPLGFYSFDFLKTAGVDALVVNTFHLAEKIKEVYRKQNVLPVHFSEEAGHILGSGGGLWKAKSHFQNEDDFFLLNADEIIITENPNLFADLKAYHEKERALSTLLVMDHPEVGHKFGGVWVDTQNRVIGFGKQRPQNAAHGYHFLGVQALNQEVFRFIPEKVESNILYDALMAALREDKKVQVFKAECTWFETGNLNDYLLATFQVLQGFASGDPAYANLRKFLKAMTPQSQLEEIEGSLVWKHSESRILDTTFKKFAVVADGVQIQNSVIEASVISESHALDSQKVMNQLIL